MKNIKLLIVFLSINACLFGQNQIEYKGEIINGLDEQGQQTGIWKVYNDKENVVITTTFDKGVRITDTKYYKDNKLFAASKFNDQIEIYKGKKTIKAKFFRKEDGNQTIVDQNGKELNDEILSYFYSIAEAPSLYYGGSTALNNFISKNINTNATNKNSGKINIEFVVDTKGQVDEVNVTESSNPKLNEEAIRIVKSFPRWQPGHQAGAFVKTRYAIPITIN